MGFFGTVRPPKIGGLIKGLGLGSWYNGLSSNQREKLHEYSPHRDHLTEGDAGWSSVSAKKLLWLAAGNALHAGDTTFARTTAEFGLKAAGRLADQHFLYNVLIETACKDGDYQRAIDLCIEEIHQFRAISADLKKDIGVVPPSLPCRDTLLDLAVYSGDAKQAVMAIDLMVINAVISQDEGREYLVDAKDEADHVTGLALLEKGSWEEGIALLEALIGRDPIRIAITCKEIGDRLLAAGRKQQAFAYFTRALKADPLVKGVKRKHQSLAKKFGVQAGPSNEDVLAVLRDKETHTTAWYGIRDLANAYAGIGRNDDAWRLFKKALAKRRENDSPADTIYPQMARLSVKEKNYKQAIHFYMLAYRELAVRGILEPKRGVLEGVDRCLRLMGISHLEARVVLGIVSTNPGVTDSFEAELDRLISAPQ